MLPYPLDINKEYPNNDFYDWHGKLTGSCSLGRESFAKNNGIDLSGKMTVSEFISLTENAYGSDVIKQVKNALNL